ncbi:BQ2448_3693 [Microbotryum intermedium]|uniref:BQ2448_3693 protein n=1 Tax=Microbotryum intermedium TaxID=269621 RepID=A0A238FFM9_9BASI|nr:BQ2448_3693 [Microbotryum intermedium]
MVAVDDGFIDYSGSIKSGKGSHKDRDSDRGTKPLKRSKSRSKSKTSREDSNDEHDAEHTRAPSLGENGIQDDSEGLLPPVSTGKASRKSMKAKAAQSSGGDGEEESRAGEVGAGATQDQPTGFAVPKQNRVTIPSVVSDSPPVINYSRKTSTISKSEQRITSRAKSATPESDGNGSESGEPPATAAPLRSRSSSDASGARNSEDDDEEEEEEGEDLDGSQSPKPPRLNVHRRRSSQGIPGPHRKVNSPLESTFAEDMSDSPAQGAGYRAGAMAGPGPYDSPLTQAPAGPKKLRRKSAGAASLLVVRGIASAAADRGRSSTGAAKLVRRKSSSSQRRTSTGQKSSKYESAVGESSSDEDSPHAGRRGSRARTGSRGVSYIALGEANDDEEESAPAHTSRPHAARRQSAISFSRVDIEYDEEEDDLKQKGSARSYGPGLGSTTSTASANPSPQREVNDMDLTPQDRHYLNRIMINLEIQREGSALSKIGALTVYGEPFLPHPNGPNSRPRHLAPQGGGLLSMVGMGGGEVKREAGFENYEWKEGQNLESPVLRYLFWRFLYHMPVLREAKPEYWTDRIQPFWDSFMERDLSTTAERAEITKRRLLGMGFTRVLGTYTSTCLPPQGRHAPARPSITVMRRIDHLVPGSMDSLWITFRPNERIAYNAWSAIVSEEESRGETAFLIVSRVLVVEGGSTYLVLRKWSAFVKLAQAMEELDPKNSLGAPLLPVSSPKVAPPRPQLQQYLRMLIIALSSPPPQVSDSATLSDARTKLEAFLLGSAEKASLQELQEWVAEGERDEDKAEQLREQWVRVGRRGKKLRTTWALYRSALISGAEVDKSMALVKRISQLKTLPESYRDAEEWARIWVAYMFHYFFISSENGPEILALLKSFHDLIPYAALKLGLSLVNPTLAIRAIVQILLGQPAGQASLFQRIFAIICNSGIKQQKKLAAQFRARIDSEVVCAAIEKHVYSAHEVRQATRAQAENRGEEIVITIMRAHANDTQVKMLKDWQSEYVRRGGVEVEVDNLSKAGKFQNVKGLLAAICRTRDREQVMGVVMESNTPKTLHASVSIFYKTIYKVAEASNLSERLGDLQAFLDDMIKVSYSEKNTPADFIALAARHDQKLYYIAHELASNGGTLLDPLIDWSKSGLAFIREGVPPVETRKSGRRRRTSTSSRRRGGHSEAAPESPQRAGVDYDTLLASQPERTRKAVLSEIRALARWTSYRKVYSDISLRVDLLQVEHPEPSSAAGAWAASLDKEVLYEDLLLQDREVMDLLVKREDSPMEFGWFGELEGINGLLVDWRRVEKVEKSVAEKRRRQQGKTARRGLFKKSSTTNDDQEEEVEESKKTSIQLPTPSVNSSKTLLVQFIDSIGPALRAAIANDVK